MAGRSRFEIRLDGLEAILDNLDRIEQGIDQQIEQKLVSWANKINHDAKRLAPLDTGDLEAALVVGEVQQTGEIMHIELGASPEVDHYSVVQHEGFMHTKDGRLVELKPGEKTRSKGMYNGYAPGKKFLEYALNMNEKAFFDDMAEVLKG